MIYINDESPVKAIILALQYVVLCLMGSQTVVIKSIYHKRINKLSILL